MVVEEDGELRSSSGGGLNEERSLERWPLLRGFGCIKCVIKAEVLPEVDDSGI